MVCQLEVELPAVLSLLHVTVGGAETQYGGGTAGQVVALLSGTAKADILC